MAWERNETNLGITITGNKLRIVESELVNEQFNLLNVAEIQLDIPFDFYVIGNDDFVPKFSEAINNLVESYGIRASSAAFAIERRMILLNKLLIDRTFSSKELKQHIHWETEQYVVSDRNEYNIAYERLGFFNDNLEEVLVVAARKAIVLYLKEIFYRTSLNLKILDIDIFAAIRALTENMELNVEGYSAIVDYSEHGVDLCVIRDGKYYTSTEVTPSREGSDIRRFTEVSDVEMANIVTNELQKLLTATNLNVDLEDLKIIHLIGDQINSDFILELEKLQQANVTIANPFQGQKLSLDSAGEITETQEHPERFLVNVGLVLRRDV